MAGKAKAGQDRSVRVGGGVTGGVIQTGDGGAAYVNFQRTTLPTPQSVNIGAELAALRDVLAKLDSLDGPDRKVVHDAVADAEDRLGKPTPDKDKIGMAVARALEYAKTAKGFAEVLDDLRPRVVKIVAWLGKSWYRLLSVVGMAA